MLPREIFDDLGQKIGRNGWNHADAQASREAVARGARKIAELVDRAQDLANALKQLLAKRRQRYLASAALLQHAAERLLHLLDLHGERRLRDRTGLGRMAEMAVTHQRIEIAKLSEGDVYHQFILLPSSLISILPDEKGRVDCGRLALGRISEPQEETIMDDKTKCPFTGGTR